MIRSPVEVDDRVRPLAQRVEDRDRVGAPVAVRRELRPARTRVEHLGRRRVEPDAVRAAGSCGAAARGGSARDTSPPARGRRSPSGPPSERRLRPRGALSPATSVRSGRSCESRMLTVMTSRCRKLDADDRLPAGTAAGRREDRRDEGTGDRALDELQPLRDRERRGRRHDEPDQGRSRQNSLQSSSDSMHAG